MTRTGKRKRSTYSKGEINRMIDSLIHPLLDLNPAFSLVDTLLHGFVERNPPETALKFLRYNLPRIFGRDRRGKASTQVKARNLPKV